MTQHLDLRVNAFGKLVLSTAQGSIEGVLPVRAFPIQSPEQGIALMDPEGHEAVWIEDLQAVSEPAQGLIRQALEGREFMPEIQAITAVTSFSMPSTWTVRTHRGTTQFVLRGEEDIRRLSATALLITDSHGIQFLIRDTGQLSRESKKILDRFK